MGHAQSTLGRWGALACAGLLAGCGAAANPGEPADPAEGSTPIDPGTSAVAQEQALLFDALREEAEAAQALGADGALAAYPTTFRAGLSYDPAASLALDTIQASALALSEAELAKLGEQGFVVSTRREFPTFLRGFAEIYAEHLPLYVSADAILESIHSSYDTILLSIEAQILVPDLDALLEGMHARLANSDASASVKADAELYLAVALGLLDGTPPTLVAGADSARVDDLIARAVAADGIAEVELFGIARMEDFSQFKPRGHYTDEEPMQRYFRAMMWLGRVDLRIIETLTDGRQVFRPDQYRAMLLLHALIEPDIERWQRIDDAIRTFVGESDYMVVPEVALLVEDLGGAAEAQSANDQAVVEAIVAGGYGQQQIASHLMVNDGTVKTLPLNRSFLLFGQRYIADSHVFSEVVYDRIADRADARPARRRLRRARQQPGAGARARSADRIRGAARRARAHARAGRRPRPGFLAGEPLQPVADRAARAVAGPRPRRRRRRGPARGGDDGSVGPARAEHAARLLGGAPARHAALRQAVVHRRSRLASSPTPTSIRIRSSTTRSCATPSRARGSSRSPRGRRASSTRRWRATSTRCATWPHTWARWRERSAPASRSPPSSSRSSTTQCASIASRPAASRSTSRTAGTPTCSSSARSHSSSTRRSPTCTPSPPTRAATSSATCCTSAPATRAIIVTTVDTCDGPRAYAGVVYAYHELVTEDFERLTDEQWAQRFSQGGVRPAEVPWLADVLAQ